MYMYFKNVQQNGASRKSSPKQRIPRVKDTELNFGITFKETF
jgi:hypothetical protein